jgi:hypothetical protein
MNIRTVIEGIVTEMGLTFKYANMSELNEIVDHCAFPLVTLAEVRKSSFKHEKSGAMKDVFPIEIIFETKQDELGGPAIVNDAKIQAMRMLARDFVNRLHRSDIFEANTNYEMDHMVNQRDAITACVLLSTRLTTKLSDSIC